MTRKRHLPKTFNVLESAKQIRKQHNPKHCGVEFVDSDLRLVLRAYNENGDVIFEYDTGLSGYETPTKDMKTLADSLVNAIGNEGIPSFYRDMDIETLEAIRQAMDLDEGDCSKDDKIHGLTLHETLDLYLQWEGIQGYTSAIVEIAKLFGANDRRINTLKERLD